MLTPAAAWRPARSARLRTARALLHLERVVQRRAEAPARRPVVPRGQHEHGRRRWRHLRRAAGVLARAAGARRRRGRGRVDAGRLPLALVQIPRAARAVRRERGSAGLQPTTLRIALNPLDQMALNPLDQMAIELNPLDPACCVPPALRTGPPQRRALDDGLLPAAARALRIHLRPLPRDRCARAPLHRRRPSRP
eukprot:2854581-Prymnesium_polylepis.1